MKRNVGLLAVSCLSAAALFAGCATPPWGAKAADASGVAAAPGSPLSLSDATANSSKKSGKPNPLAMARLCERRNQLPDALRLYQDVIKQTPNDPAAYHRLGVTYCRMGKFKEADENFQQALKLKPDNAELLSDAGYFLHLANRPQEAENCLRRALELEPANRAYCNNLAVVLGTLGRNDESLALFRRAGSDKQATANYAFVLVQRGEYQQAFDIYDRLLTEDQSMRVAADAMIELSKYVPRNAAKPAPPAAAESAVAVVQSPARSEPTQAGPGTSMINSARGALRPSTELAVVVEPSRPVLAAAESAMSREGVSCAFAGPSASNIGSAPGAAAATVDNLRASIADAPADATANARSSSIADRIAIALVLGLGVWGTIAFLGVRRQRSVASASAPVAPTGRPRRLRRPLGGLRDALAKGSAECRPREVG